MKGAISVQSKPQMGSEFLCSITHHQPGGTFELDYTLENIQPVEEEFDYIETKEQELNAAQIAEDENILVLLIESNKDVASYIKTWLPLKYAKPSMPPTGRQVLSKHSHTYQTSSSQM
ncbi:MAG: hypothetical protein U5L72_01165 [Bacteroidales bacterium]|nr:hypothetical protein [Bacteroidales bacterium]